MHAMTESAFRVAYSMGSSGEAELQTEVAYGVHDVR